MSMRISTLVVLLWASADAFSQYSAITAAATGLAKSRCFAKRAPPPPPAFKPKPLPVILAGGLFLFGSSVNPNDRKLVDKLLVCVQRVLDKDPTMTMELGQGTTTGGVYSSLRETSPDGIEKIIAQFQIEGGNVGARNRLRDFGSRFSGAALVPSSGQHGCQLKWDTFLCPNSWVWRIARSIRLGVKIALICINLKGQ